MTTTAPKVNGLICASLTIDKDNAAACFMDSPLDRTKCDTKKVLVADLKDTKAPTAGYAATEAGAIAQCRSMYDENTLDYKFCCQVVATDSGTTFG